MIFSNPNVHTWGNPSYKPAKVISAPLLPAGEYNKNYIKSSYKKKTPIGKSGQRTPYSQGSTLPWGIKTANLILPPTTPASEYNKNYIKGSYKKKTPIPKPYNVNDAFKQLMDAGEETVDKPKLDRMEIVKNLYTAANGDEKKYWGDILGTLTKLELIKSKRQLTRDELNLVEMIDKRINDYKPDLSIPPQFIPTLPDIEVKQPERPVVIHTTQATQTAPLTSLPSASTLTSTFRPQPPLTSLPSASTLTSTFRPQPPLSSLPSASTLTSTFIPQPPLSSLQPPPPTEEKAPSAPLAPSSSRTQRLGSFGKIEDEEVLPKQPKKKAQLKTGDIYKGQVIPPPPPKISDIKEHKELKEFKEYPEDTEYYNLFGNDDEELEQKYGAITYNRKDWKDLETVKDTRKVQTNKPELLKIYTGLKYGDFDIPEEDYNMLEDLKKDDLVKLIIKQNPVMKTYLLSGKKLSSRNLDELIDMARESKIKLSAMGLKRGKSGDLVKITPPKKKGRPRKSKKK